MKRRRRTETGEAPAGKAKRPRIPGVFTVEATPQTKMSPVKCSRCFTTLLVLIGRFRSFSNSIVPPRTE